MHNDRCNTFSGDKDNIEYAMVNKSRLYGSVVFIRKEDYVNHVTNEQQLRRLVKEYKGKRLEDGKGTRGKGRLTNERIEARQIFYGRIIFGNK